MSLKYAVYNVTDQGASLLIDVDLPTIKKILCVSMCSTRLGAIF